MKSHDYWISVWFASYVGAMATHKGLSVAIVGAVATGFFAWFVEVIFVRNRNRTPKP